ncbi:hypothetical protein JYU34_009670, partial [Plutella xylostella]
RTTRFSSRHCEILVLQTRLRVTETIQAYNKVERSEYVASARTEIAAGKCPATISS